ncbi:MAG: DUF3991 domain-containing protein [Clostridia bacterium]|nr:DUF3991 domain-containing protein [Clostridia bacterium]
MKNRVGKSQIEAAKSVNLVIYLQTKHPYLIMQDKKYHSRYVHPEHDSLVITSRGFYRFSVGKGGDQIQFLQDYVYNGDFIAAVRALAEYAGECPIWDIVDAEKSSPKPFMLPSKEPDAYKRVWAYLTVKRHIPASIVQELFDEKTLYQAEKYGNCVFVSRDCKYAEIVGTSDTRYKGIAQGADADGYWVTGCSAPDKVYVCESAIDAVSLMSIHRKSVLKNQHAYASLGGLKHQSLQRLMQKYSDKCVLAIDSDDAANKFAEQHPELERIIPTKKDWNDVLREQ